MKARARTLALAAALAALLGAVVAGALLLVERPDEAARARHDREKGALSFRPGEVAWVTIAPRGATAVRIARDGAGFEGLLQGLAGMQVRSSSPAGQGGLASRGLDPPAVRLTLTLRDGRELRLDVGDENTFDRTRFGRRDGEILAIEGVPEAVLDPPSEGSVARPAGR